MKIASKNQLHLLKVALGEAPADVLIKNVQLVNVISGEIYDANVYICDRIIAHIDTEHVSNYQAANQIIDANHAYLIPGFIDAHIHIESSMMTPIQFTRCALPHGTTTIVSDPHEIANVFGIEGVRYMVESSEDVPMRHYINIPSCVPALPGLETSGAAFYREQIRELTKLPRIMGLGEVMNFTGAAYGEDRMQDILNEAQDAGLYLQGHAPFVSGRLLSAYICAGPITCHESRSSGEAQEKLRNGMWVDARESSISKNVKDVWNGVKHMRYTDQLCLCSDDREADEILRHGHMNDIVRSAMQAGMDPIQAIRCATLHPAREIHVENLGAIAPGYVADLQLVNDLQELKPTHVFYEGKLVAKDGELCTPIQECSFPIEMRNSIQLPAMTMQDFIIKAPIKEGMIDVHVMEYIQLTSSITKLSKIALPVVNGELQLLEDMSYVAVINRYGKGNMAFGIVKGFGIEKGTLASTVSHDSHNVTIVYDQAAHAMQAMTAIEQAHGGMCAVDHGEVLYTLALPVGGLLSLKSAQDLSVDAQMMKQAIHTLGLRELKNPLLRIATLALPVIPAVKMSDLGMIDVNNKKFIPMFCE